MGYPIIQLLPEKQPVEIIDQSSITDNTWVHVRQVAQEGWVNSKFLEASIDNGSPQQKHVIGNGLNLRQEAGPDQQIVLTLPAGTEVEILGDDQTIDKSTWIRVRQVPAEGWVSIEFLAP